MLEQWLDWRILAAVGSMAGVVLVGILRARRKRLNDEIEYWRAKAAFLQDPPEDR